MSTLITGKALVAITKVDSRCLPYDVTTFVQTANGGPFAHECAQENLSLIGAGFPLPVSGKRMKIGETIRVAISYELFYSQDYWGECDVDIVYNKVRVLRRQKPRKPPYRTPSHNF